MRIPRIHWLLASLLLLAACSGQSTFPMAPEDILPAFLREAPPRVRDAYRFAIANPDELAHYPCYCGCGGMGHDSNLGCYLEEDAPEGQLIIDNHAAGCGICVDITYDVMRLMNEGQSRPDIRAYIDARYGAFGPSTNTAYPTE